jgi:superoxide dismutase
MAKVMKKAQTGKNVPKGMVESEMFPGKMIPKSKSNYANGEYVKMLDNNRKAILNSAAKKVAKQSANEISKSPAKKPMKAGGMLKRADGSYSKRGLWDNIRANKGSGKKPTAQMLKQEKKIKAKTKK